MTKNKSKIRYLPNTSKKIIQHLQFSHFFLYHLKPSAKLKLPKRTNFWICMTDLVFWIFCNSNLTFLRNIVSLNDRFYWSCIIVLHSNNSCINFGSGVSFISGEIKMLLAHYNDNDNFCFRKYNSGRRLQIWIGLRWRFLALGWTGWNFLDIKNIYLLIQLNLPINLVSPKQGRSVFVTAPWGTWIEDPP